MADGFKVRAALLDKVRCAAQKYVWGTLVDERYVDSHNIVVVLYEVAGGHEARSAERGAPVGWSKVVGQVSMADRPAIVKKKPLAKAPTAPVVPATKSEPKQPDLPKTE